MTIGKTEQEVITLEGWKGLVNRIIMDKKTKELVDKFFKTGNIVRFTSMWFHQSFIGETRKGDEFFVKVVNSHDVAVYAVDGNSLCHTFITHSKYGSMNIEDGFLVTMYGGCKFIVESVEERHVPLKFMQYCKNGIPEKTFKELTKQNQRS